MANFPRYDGHLYIDAYSGNIVRDFTIGTTLGIGSNATVGGTLSVTGATTLSSTLGVTGNATITGNILGTGDITRTGDMTLTNTTTGAGGITVNSTDASGDSELNLQTTGGTFNIFQNQDGNTSISNAGGILYGHGGALNSQTHYLGFSTNSFSIPALTLSTLSGSGTTVTSGEVHINSASNNIDFRVNSDNVADAIKVDAQNDLVYINTSLQTTSDLFFDSASYVGLTPGIRLNYASDIYENRLISTFMNDFNIYTTSFTGITPGIFIDYSADTFTNRLDTTFTNDVTFTSGTTVDFTGVTTPGLSGGGGGTSWQTTAKTADFTAVAGEGYFVNTNGGAVTMTLPASPSGGDEVKVVDYGGDFATNNLTITSASENIRGSSVDHTVNLDRAGISLVYSDATQGWQVFSYAKEEAINGAAFVAATGGTITTDGDYKVHTFNSSGTFTITDAGDASGSNTFDVLIVAGGGGGGSINSAGGGAGGLNYQTGVSAVAQAYTVTIGAGGTGGGPGDINTGTPLPTNGNDTDFTGQTSAVGGGRAGQNRNAANVAGSPYRDGGNGGSGGGAGEASGAGTPGTGTVGQGNDGGQAAGSPQYPGGGGGGAGAVGGNAASSGPAGNGGNGLSNSITGSATDYAGGGGAGARTSVVAGVGGTGGGGAGAAGGTNPGISGTTNLGGGGGGAGMNTSSPYFSSQGGNGGSGVVIVRYKFQ
jgi:hypothetical protein